MSHMLTREVAMDCEMVQDSSNQDMVARVTIVNNRLECVYDKYVRPTRTVGDYRTTFSGIRAKDLNGGESFQTVKSEVAAILHGRILVGHAVQNDLKVLSLSHPPDMTKDIQSFDRFKNYTYPNPSLKDLARRFLNTEIQRGEHSSLEDAKTTMKLYQSY